MDGPQWSEAKARATWAVFAITVMLALLGMALIMEQMTGWVSEVMNALT